MSTAEKLGLWRAASNELANFTVTKKLLLELINNIAGLGPGGSGSAGLSHVLFVDQTAPGPGVRGAASLELANRFPTIQAALDQMQPGDNVLLNPDTYDLGSGGLDWPALAGFGTLMGLAPFTVQIVNDGTRPVITFARNDVVAFLRNLTLTNNGGTPCIRAIGQGGLAELFLDNIDGSGATSIEATDWFATVVQGETFGNTMSFTDCGLVFFDHGGGGFNRPDVVVTSPKGTSCTVGLGGSVINNLFAGTALEPMPFGLLMDATSIVNEFTAYLATPNGVLCQGGRFTDTVTADFGGVAAAAFLGCTFQGDLRLTSSGTRTRVVATGCQWPVFSGKTISAGAFVDLDIRGASYADATLVSSGGADAGTIDRDTYEVARTGAQQTAPGSGIYEVPFLIGGVGGGVIPFPAGITDADYIILFTPCNALTQATNLYVLGGNNVRVQLQGAADNALDLDVQIVRKRSPAP